MQAELAKARAEAEDLRAAALSGIQDLTSLAVATRVPMAELVRLSADDIADLLREKGVGAVLRHRIADEHAAQLRMPDQDHLAVAVSLAGMSTAACNGVYVRTSRRSVSSATPVLQNQHGIFCYYRGDEWVVDMNHEPDGRKAYCRIAMKEGPLPTGEQEWQCFVDDVLLDAQPIHPRRRAILHRAAEADRGPAAILP